MTISIENLPGIGIKIIEKVNNSGLSGDRMISEDKMKHQISHTPDVRERTIRLVFGQQKAQ